MFSILRKATRSGHKTSPSLPCKNSRQLLARREQCVLRCFFTVGKSLQCSPSWQLIISFINHFISQATDHQRSHVLKTTDLPERLSNSRQWKQSHADVAYALSHSSSHRLSAPSSQRPPQAYATHYERITLICISHLVGLNCRSTLTTSFLL